ncbi:MAG: AAA family ATPase [Verrucomicrobiota bacterium]
MSAEDPLAIGSRLSQEVLVPMKEAFVEKDEIIDLLGLCLLGGENLFILGPPGTAKSALVHELGQRFAGQTFEYLLTRFTEPNELFGPFDIRKLRDGVLETNTEGMLPEASLVFLDELLNANSAILNSILTVLNERVLRRGRETHHLPLLMVVGASNHLPEEEALQALFDRFLLRVRSDNVTSDELGSVLEAGWRLEQKSPSGTASTLSPDDIRIVHDFLSQIDLSPIRDVYLEAIERIRRAGLRLSDRRAVKLQRLIAASALLCERKEARVSDLWILRYIWDLEEQAEIIRAIVDEILEREMESEAGDGDHPRSRENEPPDAETLAARLHELEEVLGKLSGDDPPARSQLRDQLSLVSSRSQWVTNEHQRQSLQNHIDRLWKNLGPTAP